MLCSKRVRRVWRKSGWYSDQYRPHFDRKLDFASAKMLVENEDAVRHHSFLPLITFSKTERRYRSSQSFHPKAKLKIRPLAYVSNKDGYIYSYYASTLQDKYDKLLNFLLLDKVVIGYRKGMSNITLARDAFDEIMIRGECCAIALDIQGFFDNIDHSVLKRAWTRVLDASHLPPDHQRVFTSLTRSPSVALHDCMKRLGIDLRTKYGALNRPLCSNSDFRTKICGKDGLFPSLVAPVLTKGIPQGTPISAVAANISMLNFDIAMNSEALRLNGSYRRYSDDILLICPNHTSRRLETFLKAALASYSVTLQISPQKTNRVKFSGKGCRVSGKPLQYLGFCFDGVKRHIRPGTISRFQQRMASGVRLAKWHWKQVEAGKAHGRDIMHRKELHARYTHLGKDSFMRGYGKLAKETVGLNGIKQQLGRTPKLLEKMIARERPGSGKV